MKKLLPLSLVCLSIFGAGSAMALSQGQNLAVTVNGFPAGTANAALISGTPTSCAYDLQWTSAGGLSVDCNLSETSTATHRSCVSNGVTNFSTIVTSSGACAGFDALGFPQAVTLFLGESGGSPALSGLEIPATSPFPLSINFT